MSFSDSYASILETLAKTDEKLAYSLNVSNSIQRQQQVIKDFYKHLQESSQNDVAEQWISIQNTVKSFNQNQVNNYKKILYDAISTELNHNNLPSSSKCIFEESHDGSIANNYVTVAEAPIKEFRVPEELVIPVGHNRVRISLSLLLTVIGIIVSVLLGSFSASSTNQEEQIQILYDILESVESDSSEQKPSEATQPVQ